MNKSKKSAKRTARSFTSALKAERVLLCQVGGRNNGQVGSDLKLTKTALRDWVLRSKIYAGNGSNGPLTTDKRDELAPL